MASQSSRNQIAWPVKVSSIFSSQAVLVLALLQAMSVVVVGFCLQRNKKGKRKCKRELNMEHKTLLWLRCDKDETDKLLVSTLWCKICRRYKDRLNGMRNYSGAWISGSTNHKTSNVINHSKSDKHTFSMARSEADRAKAQGKSVPLLLVHS